MKNNEKWIIFPFLVILVLLFYLPAINGPFIIDDMATFITGKYTDEGQVLSNFFSNPRSLVNLSFVYNFQLLGNSPTAYRIVNILIHGVNVVLVYLISRLIFQKSLKNIIAKRHYEYWAVFAALLFALHPMASSAVNYIVQRYELLLFTFFITTFYFYIKYKISQNITYYYYALLMVVPLSFTKESSAIIPLVLLAFDISFAQNKNFLLSFKYYLKLLPFFLPAMIIIRKHLLRLVTDSGILNPDYLHGMTSLGSDSDNFSRFEYTQSQIPVLKHYIEMFVFPIRQQTIYENQNYIVDTFFDLNLISSIVLISILFSLVVYFFKTKPLISFSITLIFLLNFITSFVVVLGDVIFDYREYLPLFGYVLLLSYLISMVYSKFENMPKYKSYKNFVIIIPLLIYGLFGLHRNYLMGDGTRMFAKDFTKIPENYRVLEHYWISLVSKPDYERALEVARHSYNIAPDQYDYGQFLAPSLFHLNNYPEAQKYYLIALEQSLDTDHERTARINVSWTYVVLKEFALAQEQLDILLEKFPLDHELYKRKAFIYQQLGDEENTYYYSAIAIELEKTADVNAKNQLYEQWKAEVEKSKNSIK